MCVLANYKIIVIRRIKETLHKHSSHCDTFSIPKINTSGKCIGYTNMSVLVGWGYFALYLPNECHGSFQILYL